MKTLKRNLILPLMVMAFGITGAFVTNAMESTQSTQKTGYIDAPRPCEIPVECSTIGEEFCTNEAGLQAFGKVNPNDTTCPQELFRLMP